LSVSTPTSAGSAPAAPRSQRHIGYVLKRFPRISETFVAAELIELARQGEWVTVFAVSRPEEPFEHGFLEELEARVVYLPHRPLREPVRTLRGVAHAARVHPSRWLRVAAGSLWPLRRKGLRRLLQASVLRRELALAGIDHQHAHFATTAARVAGLVRRMGGPTYSVTTHAKDIYHEDVEVAHLRDRLLDASFVATVSEGNRRHLEGLLGINGRLRVVHNSVDLRRLPWRERRPEPGLVVSVGRLIEKKGIDDLVTACGMLASRGTPARLEIVGHGPLRAELESAAGAAGVDARFHGALPQELTLELLRRASVFSLPCVVASTGDRDGLPTSVLEAMALGVPVVTTGVNGLSEAVLDGQTGLTVPERDPAALAAALERVLGDPGLAERLGGEARRHVEQSFDLRRSVGLLRSLFPRPA